MLLIVFIYYCRLNGPNTWTDWAIEGRRTIPLLPRLKSHTAFTGLANSLSLVLAAANEKKIPSNESQDSIGLFFFSPIQYFYMIFVFFFFCSII